MNTPQTFIALDRKPHITLLKVLGILLALIIIWVVLFIILSKLPTLEEFFIEISIVLTIIILVALGIDHFLQNRESNRLKLVYSLRVDTSSQKIRLEKNKACGFIQFQGIQTQIIHQGCFVTLKLWSNKSQRLLGTLTNKDDRWKPEDILSIANQLKSNGIDLQEKTLSPGVIAGNQVVFQRTTFNVYILLLFVVLSTLLITAYISQVLQEYPLSFTLTWLIVYVILVYPQKQYTITSTHLIVKNRWLPLYRYRLAISHIKSIDSVTAFARRDIQEYLKVVVNHSKKDSKTYRFYSVLGREHIRQVVYLVIKKQQSQVNSP